MKTTSTRNFEFDDRPTKLELHLLYALSKQTASMSNGFVIQTDYGDLRIKPGLLALALRGIVQNALRKELVPPENKRRGAATQRGAL